MNYFAEKNLREAKMRLHRQYGPGLKSLYNPHAGTIDMHAYVRGRRLRQNLPGITGTEASSSAQSVTLQIGNTTINMTMFSSFFLGWASGLQYKTSFPSDCLYSVVNLFNSLDYIVNDFNNLGNSSAYYDTFIYQPSHVAQNALSTYE